MEPDAKLTLFKLLHITLVVHYPQIPDGNGPYVLDTKATSDILKSNYADDPALWYKHLRNIFHIIEREIIQLNQSNLLQSNPSICNVFVQMAARACAVVSKPCHQKQNSRILTSFFLHFGFTDILG